MSNQKTTASESENSNPSLDEQGVADYLRRHPSFFEDKPTLLSDLRVPHTIGSAVSLVERQVAVLRERKAGLQAQLEDLIQVACENDKLNALLHQFTLQLIECDALAAMLTLIDKQLRRAFSADLVAVRLLTTAKDQALMSSRPEFSTDADALRGAFQRLLSAGKPYCGQLKAEQLEVLFGDHAESVASNAFLPLGKRGEMGLVAIGSFERDRYHANADTAFLGSMSEVMAAALGRHLQQSS